MDEQGNVTPSSDAQTTPPAGAQNTDGHEQSEHMIPKSRLDEVLARQRAAEAELQQLRSAQQQAEEKKRLERGEHEQVIAELRPKAERVDELTTTLQSYLDAELENVPENFRHLVPDGDVVTRLQWVQKARQSGLFNPLTPPTDDIGRTGDSAQRKDKPQPSDTVATLADLAKQYGHSIDLGNVATHEERIAERRDRFVAKRKQQSQNKE